MSAAEFIPLRDCESSNVSILRRLRRAAALSAVVTGNVVARSKVAATIASVGSIEIVPALTLATLPSTSLVPVAPLAQPEKIRI